MRISVTEAKGQLTELVSRAEAGEEVVLTRHDKATVEWCLCVCGLTPRFGAR